MPDLPQGSRVGRVTTANFTAGDLSAAAAVVEVRAATAGAARASLLALAERLRGVAIPEAARGGVLDLGGNRTTPRAGALTPGVPSGPRPQSDATGEDYHQW